MLRSIWSANWIDLTIELRRLLTEVASGLCEDSAEFRLFVTAFHELCETLYHAQASTNGAMRERYSTDDVNAWHEVVLDLERQFGPDNLTLEILMQELDLRSRRLPSTKRWSDSVSHGSVGHAALKD